MADAVRCGEGNREDEVVEDEFNDSIELEDNDVDLQDDDAEKRFEVVRDVDVRDASADSESESDEDMVGSVDDFESEEDNEGGDGCHLRARKMTISTPVLQSQEFISVGSQPPTQGIQSQDANVIEEQVIY
ncbi:hypothetical protein Salat_1899900 [Sesamum alatum]|uniref:Uncharacterized protein n=1 Tax=Sesamum alatum TaxID=300844 RepID=A0AAE2CI93_9LAMI|nr:hypothetical protein Salat_1899900 [Sesamum alatum]